MSAPAAKKEDLTVGALAKSDTELKENKLFQALLPKVGYTVAASDASVAAAAKALTEKKFKATIVNSAKEAVDLVASLVPQKASVGFGGSSTFEQIGLTDYFKTRNDLNNYRLQFMDAMGKQDWAGVAAARSGATVADYFLTSVSGLAETGAMVFADLTGTRTSGVLGAKNVILVTGANKIVPTYADAIARLHDYCLPAESARSRVVYKVPGSAINNEVHVRGADPWGTPGRIHVIIIKGLSFGF